MKRIVKRLGLLALALTMLVSLCACGGGLNEMDATRYIQGILDENYRGTFDKEFLKLVDSTEDEAREIYRGALEVEAQFFMNYFEIYSEDEALFDRVVEMYQEIYSHSDYTVHPASKLSNGGFAVEVTVKPIDLFHKVDEALGADTYPDCINAWLDKYADADVDAMTDEEYEQYDYDYGVAIVELCEGLLPELGHLDETSIVLQVKQDEDEVWNLPDDDFGNLDALIIDYP